MPLYLAPPPAAPIVRRDRAAEHLAKIAADVQDKGEIIKARFAKIGPESFAVYIRRRVSVKTGEVWHCATYQSQTLPGHIRRAVIDPHGQAWLLFESDPAALKALHSANKYAAHLTRTLGGN